MYFFLNQKKITNEGIWAYVSLKPMFQSIKFCELRVVVW